MTKKRGRPKKEIPAELIQDIIYNYSKSQKTSGKISYMDIFRYSQELFVKGEIPYSLGEFFWRKGEGRNAVDTANQVILHSFTDPFDQDEVYVDTEDAINKFFPNNEKNKQKLIQTLKMNEIKLKKYIHITQRLNKELYQTKKQLSDIKKETQSWKETATKYQETMFQWMELSINNDVPLSNLITTGTTRTKETTELLKSALSNDPLEIFHKMYQTRLDLLNKVTSNKDIPPSPVKHTRKSILDDIDF
ncbi:MULTISPECIES: hypothetical protein [Bacillus]|uniref:Uncharacterized protein n=1 Tax=Bacillus cereus TaxID=1396 RepID=A0A164PBX4_BACCE|nr:MULTISPECIES: hypothetical protein [Bacillus]KZD66768.1 hypothetical protein B4088_1979 [Bacillus cereus]TSI22012.1 hypothetical protein FOT98_05465 [Bacillus sp. HY001]